MVLIECWKYDEMNENSIDLRFNICIAFIVIPIRTYFIPIHILTLFTLDGFCCCCCWFSGLCASASCVLVVDSWCFWDNTTVDGIRPFDLTVADLTRDPTYRIIYIFTEHATKMTIDDGNRVWLTLTFGKLYAYLFYMNRFQTIFTEYIRYAIFILANRRFRFIFFNFLFTSPHRVLLIAFEEKKTIALFNY